MNLRGSLRAAAIAAAAAFALPAAAHPPYGLVADPAGNVYFSDLERVWRLSPDGRLSVFRPHVPETHVHELAVAPDGAVEGDMNRYDPATGRFYSGLWRRTAEGRESAPVPLTEAPPPGFGLLQDGAGNRYSAAWLSNADRRAILRRRTSDGKVERLFAEAGAAGEPQSSVASVGGMAFAADGALWFADEAELRRRAPDGGVTLVHRGGVGASLRGVAGLADGRVLVADLGRKEVIAVAAAGAAEILYREHDRWLPTAAAGVGGRLLVLEANEDPRAAEHRVRVIEVSDGKARVVASPGGAAAAVPGEHRSPLPTAALGALAAAGAALFVVWRARRAG